MKRFWRIKIEKWTKIKSSMIVPIGQITDRSIEKLLNVLISKHTLNDEEILSSFCKKGSKRHQNYFVSQRSTDIKGKLRITYSAQMSSKSISITLVYEDELLEVEKEKITKTSSLNLLKFEN